MDFKCTTALAKKYSQRGSSRQKVLAERIELPTFRVLSGRYNQLNHASTMMILTRRVVFLYQFCLFLSESDPLNQLACTSKCACAPIARDIYMHIYCP